ncbi:MAG TPA: AAA family ATPase [Firmicutes bacterium]|nr:AAA family ATPase [Candidatus Fermentithermobacillaceae bacterium]
MKHKELLVGTALGVLGFLVTLRVNVWPVLLVCGLGYFLYTSGGQIKGIGKSKVGTVVGEASTIRFEDIGGQNVAKRELIEALKFLRDYERASRLGIRPLKGVLLSGPPGTGKTLLAKAAANYTDSVFISASGSEFIEVYAGLGAQRIRDLFSRARSLAKDSKKSGAVIFIDEIEVLAGKRGSQVGHLEYDQTLNQLLVEMDGLRFDTGVKILVVAATNRPDLLDSAIMRPGRFDRTVTVDLPDKEGRLEILRIHLRDKPVAGEVSLENLAKETFGLSGAHLESLCNEAAINTLRRGGATISSGDLTEALNKVILGEKLERRPSDGEMQRICAHEAGHAVVAETIRPGSVAHITVSPRGNALGFVRHSPAEDRYLYPKEVLEEEIQILLAGAAAEDLMFGSKSTGAANDFRRALDIAKRLVMYGMSPIGVVDRETASLDLIARATNDIIKSAEISAARILNRYRAALVKLSEQLFEKETVSAAELRNYLDVPGKVSWKWRKPPARKSRIRRGV